ncbi:MAG: hypothetical protein AAB780_02160 [Patescibacteria group bacterium]
MPRTKKELLAEIKTLSKRIIDHKYSHRESAAVATHRMVDQAKLINMACSDLAAILAKEEQENEKLRAALKKK